MKKMGFFISIVLVLFSMAACSLFNTGPDEEIEILQNQVDALSTQNALLIEGSENENTQTSGGETSSQEESSPQVNIPTPTLESLPTAPVQAGQPISFDGWRLTVSPSVEAGEDSDASAASGTWSYIKITLSITNTTNQDKILRWIKGSIILEDDLGNTYPFLMPYSLKTCRQNYENLNSTSQLTLNAGESQEIESDIFWCWYPFKLPFFEGPIDINANSLILTVNDLGPFTGIQFIIDL